MNDVKPSRRMAISAAVLVAVVLPGSAASADANPPTRQMHDTVPRGVGAYDGSVDGKRVAFDGTIDNNSLAVSPDNTLAIATNSKSDHLVAIDLNSGAKKLIKGYTTPRNILFAPDGRSFTVTDSTLGVLDRISVRTLAVTQRLPLGAGVFGTAQTKDGKRLYANNQAASTVTAVDLAENRAVDVITGFSEPRQGVKLSPAEDRLFVTNFGSGQITIVNTADIRDPEDYPPNGPGDPDDPKPRDPKDELPVTGFNKVRGLSISPDGSRLYAANSGDNTVSIVDIDGNTREELHRVPVGSEPYGAALSPDGKVLLSGNKGSSTLTVIDPEDGTVLDTVMGTPENPLKAPRQAISFSNDSTIAWVLNEDLTIAKVDVRERKVIDTLGR